MAAPGRSHPLCRSLGTVVDMTSWPGPSDGPSWTPVMRDRFGNRGRRGAVGASDPAATTTRRRSWPAAATELSCALVVGCLTGRPGLARAADPGAVEARGPHSVDRLRARVAYLATDALCTRANATPASALAQDF